MATRGHSPSDAALPVRAPSDHDGERLVHLDNLKIVLAAGVIVAHAAMTYGAVGSWVYEEPSLSEPLAAFLGVMVAGGALFGLGLFFLMAGVLSSAPLRRRGAVRFLASRLSRLGPPLVVYAIVVWPVLRWLVDRVQNEGSSLWAFYRREFSSSHWTSAGTGPLWFVAVLLVTTAAWSSWRWARPAPAFSRAERLRGRHLGIAMASVAIGTFFIRLEFPIDSPQFLDLHVWLWPQSMVLFAFGAIGAERGWLTALSAGIRRACRRLALAAVVGIGLIALLSPDPESAEGGWHWEAAGLAAAEGVLSVTMSLLVLDWFRRRHAHQGPRRKRWAGAAYGAFVAQGPVLVLIALALRSVDLPGDVKFLLLAPTSVIVSFGLAAVARDHRPALR